MAEQQRQQQTKKMVLIVVLAVVLAAVLVFRSGLLPSGSGKSAGPAAATKNGTAGKSTTPDTKGTAATPPGAQVKWKKPDAVGPVNDPMQLKLPPDATQKTQTAEKPPEEPEYRVAGIVFSTEQPSSVIIDGRILHEGDTIYEATVVKIRQNDVILRRGDKTWTIKAGQTNKEPE